ncbi:hypothetical protein [Aurantimonas sp. VKM B-3413]|uniref:hypothetical protein n=1 Tax=Aurantimonas sp. VKM B-3413 TaxID=2779401 RepID=UPI001E61A24C|nr:hypothetical protein [Aurantimonas sp. VKM B-3413]MCB8837753.1 hypothetical protein [Aurantimonas sp. VKM B-3413]
MSIRLESIDTPEDLAEARRRFVERQAARRLASPETDGVGAGSAPRIDVAAFLSGEASPPAGTPVPLGLLRLKRYQSQAKSLAFSPAARAASTDTQIARTIGAFRLEVLEEEDAVFVVVGGPEGLALPRQLTLIHEGMRQSLDLPLGKPIGKIVQTGLDPLSREDQTVIDMLKDPETEIYLS